MWSRVPSEARMICANSASMTTEISWGRTLGGVAQGRRTLSQLAARWGLRAYPSVANFVWMDMGRPAEAVAQALLRLGVIVRPGPPGATWIRVSVGTPEEVAKFAEALEAVLKDAG